MSDTATSPALKNPHKAALRPDILFPLFASVQSLPGVGEKTRDALERLVGSRVKDLVFHLPTSLIDRRAMPPLALAQSGSTITAKVRVEEYHAPPPSKQRNQQRPFRVLCSNDTGSITLIFFKTFPDYIEKLLPLGQERIISGKVERNYGVLQMAHPDHIAPVSQWEAICTVEPVYPLTYGLVHKHLVKTIRAALSHLPALPEWGDPHFIKKNQWKSWRTSLEALHQPQSAKDLDLNSPLLSRLAYDELFASQLALQLTRKRVRVQGEVIHGDKTLQDKLRTALRFTLTQAQETALAEIQADQASPSRMMRLLQGDVGSGKTVVALFAMLNVVECGKQAALMVPTEILARQHAQWIKKVTTHLGITTALLTGRTSTKERKEILEALQTGDIQMVIGTHALFQEQVAFQDLGLAVIDEQHRFGVEQRLALTNKGKQVDTLLMTATPIPRTLTMTLYGDMDVSRLSGKPAGRLPIDTRVLSLAKMDEVVAGIARAITKGTKIYWICPLVEESETSDLAAAQERYENFSAHFSEKVGLVHGKMAAEERDPVMLAFRDGQVQLLVATTVVEVGVDVPDATLIVIEHAERFGLSQLHQLRGRVGRGSEQSTCLLLYDPKTTGQVGRSRLAIMRDTEDGFRIAEEDLRLRGSGEILGTKQSGLPNFKFANLDVHSGLLEAARDDAKLLFSHDPELTSERGQAARILLYLFEYDQCMKYVRTG